MTRDPDTLIGGMFAAAGSAGVTLHLTMQIFSLTVLALNAAVAIGGLYLIRLKIRKARRDLDHAAED